MTVAARRAVKEVVAVKCFFWGGGAPIMEPCCAVDDICFIDKGLRMPGKELTPT